MATLFLIRHAATDSTGQALSGRSPGYHLNRHGRDQAERLSRRLAKSGIQRLISSPLERARETAEPVARPLKLKIGISEALTDIDFGDWTGRTLAELEQCEEWQLWNRFRSGVRIPNGELLAEVQSRMLSEVESLCRAFPEERIALVSHADPLRTVLAYYLGMPLDLLHRLEIAPASLSIVEVKKWGAQAKLINLESEEVL